MFGPEGPDEPEGSGFFFLGVHNFERFHPYAFPTRLGALRLGCASVEGSAQSTHTRVKYRMSDQLSNPNDLL